MEVEYKPMGKRSQGSYTKTACKTLSSKVVQQTKTQMKKQLQAQNALSSQRKHVSTVSQVKDLGKLSTFSKHSSNSRTVSGA